GRAHSIPVPSRSGRRRCGRSCFPLSASGVVDGGVKLGTIHLHPVMSNVPCHAGMVGNGPLLAQPAIPSSIFPVLRLLGGSGLPCLPHPGHDMTAIQVTTFGDAEAMLGCERLKLGAFLFVRH